MKLIYISTRSSNIAKYNFGGYFEHQYGG